MSDAHALANRIKRAFTGPMWHGPSLAELLRGVTHDQAAERPAMSAHTIWELVLHIITWVDIPHERLSGSPHQNVPTDVDWPTSPTVPTEEAWQAALARLEERHRALASTVESMTDDQLEAKVAGHDYTVRVMLDGVVEHGTYHGGQIALLKKIVAR